MHEPLFDRDDVKFTIDSLGITTREEVWAIVARFFPDTPVPQCSLLLVDELLPE